MVNARPFNPAPRGPQSRPKREPPGQSHWVSIIDLERGMCRYPRNGKDGVEYCGAPAVPSGSSWCPAHHKLTCRASAISSSRRASASNAAIASCRPGGLAASGLA
jgi:hypothetical protein